MIMNKDDEKQLKKRSMMDISVIVLKEEKIALHFMNLFEKVASLKQYTSLQKESFIARFYTDLNIDGRFVMVGANKWGLKRWYPLKRSSSNH